MQILALWYDSGTGFWGFTSKRVRQLPTSLEKFLSVPSLSILIKYFNLNSLHAVHANGTYSTSKAKERLSKKTRAKRAFFTKTQFDHQMSPQIQSDHTSSG